MADHSHIDTKRQQATDLILTKLTSMAELASQCLTDAHQALLQRDGQMAYSVILRDQAIDEKEQEIDRLCLEYLVRQQPVAGHLRLIYGTMKINPNLERIGDYAESIAKQSLVISSLNLDIDFSDFKALADTAIPMVNESVRAFVERNEALAWATIEREEIANEIRDLIYGKLYDMREKGKIPLEALPPLMTIARRLERVSDQAKNICEEALYNATGTYMKHQSNEVFRILFVDQHNSHLSQMAEGIASSMNLENFVFSSAGLDPQPVNLAMAKAMQDKNCSISTAIAKSVEQIPNFEHYHVIVALDAEAKKVFPSGPTKTIGLEWSTPDLSKDESFETAFTFLTQQITDLTQAILGQNK